MNTEKTNNNIHDKVDLHGLLQAATEDTFRNIPGFHVGGVGVRLPEGNLCSTELYNVTVVVTHADAWRQEEFQDYRREHRPYDIQENGYCSSPNCYPCEQGRFDDWYNSLTEEEWAALRAEADEDRTD